MLQSERSNNIHPPGNLLQVPQIPGHVVTSSIRNRYSSLHPTVHDLEKYLRHPIF